MGVSLISLLESRLDLLVYRLNWAKSIYEARNLIAAGHISVTPCEYPGTPLNGTTLEESGLNGQNKYPRLSSVHRAQGPNKLNLKTGTINAVIPSDSLTLYSPRVNLKRRPDYLVRPGEVICFVRSLDQSNALPLDKHQLSPKPYTQTRNAQTRSTSFGPAKGLEGSNILTGTPFGTRSSLNGLPLEGWDGNRTETNCESGINREFNG